jgi:NTE family protein
MRIGLVLGAGGVLGASWMIGALDALESETGWRTAEADRIVGTSSGAVIGSLIASGLEPAYMAAYASGRSLDAFAEAEQRAERQAARSDATGSELRLERALPPVGPGSWRLAVSTLLHPTSHPPALLLAGWLPRGFISTQPIRELVERFVPGDWPDHDSFWAVAADYGNGKRVALGREDAPSATVGEAVAASCAIPGFYHPVEIDGRRYVDGGIHSASNLDLLCDDELDLVVCVNPMSSLVAAVGSSPAARLGALVRAATGRRLIQEARQLRERGTNVVVLQPGKDDVALMGLNLMSGSRRLAVMEQARKSVARELRRQRGRDVPLPRRARRRTQVRRPVRGARRAPVRRPVARSRRAA